MFFSSFSLATVTSRPHVRQTMRTSVPPRKTAKSLPPQGWGFFSSSKSPAENLRMSGMSEFNMLFHVENEHGGAAHLDGLRK